MSLIAKLLPASNVVIDLQVSSKKRLFEQAGLLFENQHGIARSVVFDSLFAREKLGSARPGPGRPEPARPAQGPQGSAVRLPAARAAGALRRARRQPREPGVRAARAAAGYGEAP